jgi:beta-glucanase (GH16 family)
MSKYVFRVNDGVEKDFVFDAMPTVGVDDTTAPSILSGPPAGFVLNGKVENWEDYPEGPVTAFKAPWYDDFSHHEPTLNGENEAELYVTPKTKALGIAYNPFSVVTKDGVKWLSITAKAAHADELKKMVWNGQQKTVLSGVLSSSLEQVYGYYEAEQILPLFKGSWFANWLMGPSWWPEFDFVEHLSTPYGSGKWWSAIHYEDNGKDRGNGGDYDLPGSVTMRHTVRALWMPKYLAVYFNDKKVFEVPNPAKAGTIQGLHDPAHRVVNLAVGGPASTWATPVDLNQLPASAFVRGLAQYSLPA